MTREFGFIKQGLRINTHNRFRSIAFPFLVFLGSAPMLYCIYCHFQADLLVAKEQTMESYSRAVTYDGDNAELWWILGRLHHYSLEGNNLSAAIQDYKHALSLNPRLGQAWIDLADCLEREGDDKGAGESIQNALKVWTYSPIVHWQAGNYYLAHNNMEGMYRHFRRAIEYDAGKLDIALNIAWRAKPDPSKILSMLVPDKTAMNLSALAFFIAHDELNIAGIIWSRLTRNSLPDSRPLDASVAFPYIDSLLSKNRIAEAYRVWMEALEKIAPRRGTVRPGTQMRAISAPNPERNLVWNGSFEEAISDGGFDWRRQITEGADIQTDSAIHADGGRSIRITFHEVNISFSHLSQILPIWSAGNYRLQYQLKTENLTTDQRPYFIIEGFPGPQSTILRTEAFPNSCEWRSYSYSFKVNPGVQAVQLSLRRTPSEKFDNQIKGSLWLDNVTIDVEKQTSTKKKKIIHDSFDN